MKVYLLISIGTCGDKDWVVGIFSKEEDARKAAKDFSPWKIVEMPILSSVSEYREWLGNSEKVGE